MNILFSCAGRRSYIIARFKETLRAGGGKVFACDASAEAPERLGELGRRIGEELRHVGALDCDVFVTANSIDAIDLNPRIGGGYPFSDSAGADLPAAYVARAQDKEPDPAWQRVRPNITTSSFDSSMAIEDHPLDTSAPARAPRVHWLGQRAMWMKSEKNPLRPLLYPPTDVGPPGLNLIAATPELFGQLPQPLQKRIVYRCIRPAGAARLVPRVGKVQITVGRSVSSATLHTTGYRIDVSKYGFFEPQLVETLRLADGYPPLTAGFESAIPGLHFLGAPAAWSFGPLCRFVSGSAYAARAVTRRIAGKSRRTIGWNLF